ncbi:proline--tRNA ligase [Paludibacterium paludis]|uniref:Proline--tRNA ligase n=1 Tax=Paludibacterium paludis TaxID=1225769 RepID=A0A918U9G0_9NEIS|nr:proline--tRNA ligase [Paludibacterium paludis]GGY15685.1 proline--tRNA ligase [Paludibacterium paludis]
MRASQYFISTLKEAPNEAELPSHKLMLRAGMIKRIASGIYTWMPLGLRVLRKVEAVVRSEMEAAGSVELFMPAVQPAELWQESGRWEKYETGLMLRIKDRHDRDFCFGPTHEEIITDIARKEINSYKQLPKNFFQIQTKFRDETRPRFGVMRAREFIMKDAYSFHADFDSLVDTYGRMYQAYSNVFSRLGLKYRAVAADTGAIGGTGSHEFQVLADSGEDLIAYCPDSDFAANIELAEAVAPAGGRPASAEPLARVATPKVKTIDELVAFLSVDIRRTVKAVVVESEDGAPVLMLVRGDHTLNEVKAEKVAGIKTPLTFASPDAIRAAFGAGPGSLGPVGFSGRVIADRTVAAMADMITGGNEDEVHLTGVNFGRDCPEPEVADIRNIVAGDPSPCGKGQLAICRGIEVGHIFQLRTRYAEPMGCTFLNREGKQQTMEMGCYGIGVSRVVAAAIEQNYDERGIIFTDAMAPFTVVIVPMGYGRSDTVRAAADDLYRQFSEAGVDVLLDDRDERPGVLLADSELIGIPHRVVIGDRGLKEGQVEYQGRRDSEASPVPLAGVVAHIRSRLGA